MMLESSKRNLRNHLRHEGNFNKIKLWKNKNRSIKFDKTAVL